MIAHLHLQAVKLAPFFSRLAHCFRQDSLPAFHTLPEGLAFPAGSRLPVDDFGHPQIFLYPEKTQVTSPLSFQLPDHVFFKTCIPVTHDRFKKNARNTGILYDKLFTNVCYGRRLSGPGHDCGHGGRDCHGVRRHPVLEDGFPAQDAPHNLPV